MNAAIKSPRNAPPGTEGRMAGLGRKIEDALVDADALGHSLLGIRLQEALDTWQELVDHSDTA